VGLSRDLTSPDLAGQAGAGVERVCVRILPDGRMTRADAARYLGHAEKTLAMWALNGRGPRSVKVGGRVFYFQRDLDAFVRGEAAG
jgi:hypothetical protein